MSHPIFARCTILVALFAVSSAHAAPTLTGGSVSGQAGTTVTLPITFDPVGTSVAGIQFSLTLPASLSAGTNQAGTIVTSAGKSISANLSGATEIFIAFGMNQTTLPVGTLLTVQLAIAPGTAAGALTLPVSNVTYVDANGVAIAPGTSSAGSVTVTAAVQAPVITSALTASGTVGTAFTYQISATNSPTSYNAAGLPAGLSINAANGLISGTPSASGTSNITLSATNSGGTGSATLSLTVGSAVSGLTNVALNTNGATTLASSEFSSMYPASGAITGNKSGAGWGTSSGGWNDATNLVYPDWLEVDFAGVKTIQEMDVYTLQDNYTAPVTPTSGMTFTQYGITDFDMQYNDGSSWITLPGGHITGNNLVWKRLAFAPLSTAKVRVVVNNSLAGYSRIVDVEAYQSTGTIMVPAITSPATAAGAVGSAFSYQITASNSPTRYDATGLPAGLSVNQASGLISGTPTTAGTSNVTISASNAGGTGTAILVLTVQSAASATFLKLDVTTQGAWKGVYGADGEAINSDGISYPPYAQVSINNSSSYVWSASTQDVRGLQKAAASDRIASTWYSNTSFTIDLNLTDGAIHQYALYAADWDGYGAGRTETIEVRDASSNALLDSRSLANFGGGQYLVWNLKGHVFLNVINTNPNSNALVNGFFFGAVAAPPAPLITSPTSATGTVASAFTYQITATNSPTSYNASGLPAGLSINQANGLISGTPTTAGVSNVTISAANAGGTGSATLTVTVNSGSDITPPSVPANPAFTNATTASMTLSWAASTDNVAVTGYRVDVGRDSGFTNFVPGYNNLSLGNVTATTINGLAPGTLYYARLRAFDAAGNVSANSAVVSAKTLEPMRINAGGGLYTDTAGNLWMNDGDYAGGGTTSTTQAITNTGDPTLYQSERYGNFTYTFAVSNGNYTVNLRFADLNNTRTGKRTFNVLINGLQVLTTFDIVAAAGGGNRAVIQSFPVSVSNGQIVIQFVSVRSNAQINAIEIMSGSGVAFGRVVLNGDPATPIQVEAGALSAARVYPNPWRADKHAGVDIIFDQMTPGSTVKIFDVAGHWVRTLQAAGSQISWDRMTDSGSPAASGIYIYLITDTQGDKAHGKLVVIR